MAYYHRDMLSIRTRNLLADYLADLAILVDSVEPYRNALAQIEAFDGISLFRFLDHNQKGYLTINDFQWLIGDRNKKILHYAFSWFDTAKVGEITRLQFVDYIFPRQDNYLRELALARMQKVVDPTLCPPTIEKQIDVFRSLVVEIMKKETRLIALRRQLMHQSDYSIKAVMNSLDGNNRGYIVTDDLFKFMKNYDIDISERQIKELVGNYDCDLNGKISLNELLWIIEGLENRIHPYRKIIRSYKEKKAVSKKVHQEKISERKKMDELKNKINKLQEQEKILKQQQKEVESQRYPQEKRVRFQEKTYQKQRERSPSFSPFKADFQTPLQKSAYYNGSSNMKSNWKNYTKQTRLWS